MSRGQPLEKRWFIVANHVHWRFIRQGAKCRIGAQGVDPTGGGHVHVLVRVGSSPRGRRWTALWTKPEQLFNARIERAYARRHSKLWGVGHPTREAAEAAADLLRASLEVPSPAP